MADRPINRVTVEDIADFRAHPRLDRYQRLATRSAIYPGKGTPVGLTYVALKLNGEAGELAEHVGKAMRDDGHGVSAEGLTPERRAQIIREAGDILWYLAALCEEMDIGLDYTAAGNLAKLADRTARGKLQGEGDNR